MVWLEMLVLDKSSRSKMVADSARMASWRPFQVPSDTDSAPSENCIFFCSNTCAALEVTIQHDIIMYMPKDTALR